MFYFPPSHPIEVKPLSTLFMGDEEKLSGILLFLSLLGGGAKRALALP
jgi:hypothetical protein